ncbi:MAG TPA: hypothetical protein PKY25_02260 [Bacilli bacterium]|nr:hypothetical protein [Bacilli bacterium]
MKNIYSELIKKGVNNPQELNEEELISVLRKHELDRYIAVIDNYGGKKNYDRALKMYLKKNASKIKVQIPLEEYNRFKRNKGKLVAYRLMTIAIVGTMVISGISSFNKSHETVTVVFSYGDSVNSVIEEFSPDYEIATSEEENPDYETATPEEKLPTELTLADKLLIASNKLRNLSVPDKVEPYDSSNPEGFGTKISITVPESRVDDVEQHNEEAGYKGPTIKR